MKKEKELTVLTKKLKGDERRIYLAHREDIKEMCEMWEKDCQQYKKEGIESSEIGGEFPPTLKDCLDFCIEMYLDDEALNQYWANYWAEFV